MNKFICFLNENLFNRQRLFTVFFTTLFFTLLKKQTDVSGYGKRRTRCEANAINR